ncbi:MAG: hypothetical protein RIQ37_738 [Actinomycetota bacterium]
MNSVTKLGLLRHGQTDWNIDLRLQGTADIPLNSEGIAQIQKAAAALKNHSWDLILTSPLSRARHSAEIVAQELGFSEVQIDDGLLERSFGIGEGLTYEQWQAQFSGLDQIPGAESMASVAKRAEKLLEDTLNRFSGRSVLAVSHGAFIRAVVTHVSQGTYPPKGERLSNASLHVFQHQGAWTLEAWAPDPLV